MQEPRTHTLDLAAVARLHRQWILVGWEKRPGDGAFDFKARLGDYYHGSSPAVVLYDDFAPDHRVARSAEEYGAFWTQPFTALREARHAVLDGPDVIVEADLACSTLEFAARLETAEGDIVGLRARSSMVWQHDGERWRIVREHNSSRRVSRAEIDSLLDHAP